MAKREKRQFLTKYSEKKKHFYECFPIHCFGLFADHPSFGKQRLNFKSKETKDKYLCEVMMPLCECLKKKYKLNSTQLRLIRSDLRISKFSNNFFISLLSCDCLSKVIIQTQLRFQIIFST